MLSIERTRAVCEFTWMNRASAKHRFPYRSDQGHPRFHRWRRQNLARRTGRHAPACEPADAEACQESGSPLAGKGEEIFGHHRSADAQTITLDAKFGKRVLPWTNLRASFFTTEETPVQARNGDNFRPGPVFH